MAKQKKEGKTYIVDKDNNTQQKNETLQTLAKDRIKAIKESILGN